MEDITFAITNTIAFVGGVFGTHYVKWNPFAVTAGWIVGTILYIIGKAKAII